MKKILIIISVILIAIGLAIAFIALWGSGFDLKNSEKTVNESEVYTGEINRVVIDASEEATDVIIKKGADEKATLEISRRENHTAEYSLNDGTLTVKLQGEKRHFYEMFDFGPDNQITLTLPEGVYESLSVKASTGDIRISSFEFSGDVTLEASTGDINIANVKANAVSLEVSTGDIEASRITVQDKVSLKSTTGDVDADGISSKTLSLITKSGETEISRVTAEAIDMESGTGDIECSEIYVTGVASLRASTGKIEIDKSEFTEKLSVTTTTGDIDVMSSDAGELEISASTGAVTLHLLTPKNFVAESSSGKKDIDGTVYTAPLCKITTSTGDITTRVVSK